MRILLQLTGGSAVIVAAFFATTAVVMYWSAPADADSDVIHVVAATYGEDCAQVQLRPGSVNHVKNGNATVAVAAACDGFTTSCLFPVDVVKLGDPADGCGKDFVVSWRCGTQPRLRQFYLPAEADRSTALIACRPW